MATTPAVPAEDNNQPLTAFQHLSRFEGAPSEEEVNNWIASAPGGRLRLYVPDGKSVFVLRAIGALELENIQKSLLNVPQERLTIELQRTVCTQATLWTNTTKSKKLTNLDLQAAPAGRAVTMHEVISELSEFLPPQLVEKLTLDF
jgi:hypothetical protein